MGKQEKRNYRKQPPWALHTYFGKYKHKTLNMKKKVACTINCNYRIATTLYTLETWFVSGI
jgi:hypothetical protein